MLTALQSVAALATMIALGTTTGALAQDAATEPDGTEMDAMETAPSGEAGDTATQAQDEAPDQPGMMSEPMDQGTMGSGMMSQGGMCSEMCSGMMEQGATEQGAMCSDMCAGMMDQGGMNRGGMHQGEMGDRATDGGAMGQGRAAPGMMDHGGMGPKTTSGMMGAAMHGHIMKIVFALADADGDGGLSLEELATIQARIFAAVDADEDGSVTPEEVQAFIRE